jgi:hypothetical protein
MTASPPRPMCFVAMPFRKRADPRDPQLIIDFDQVFSVLEEIGKGAGYQTDRADLEHSGGLIHRAMYERLLVAELVIADISFGNPNVAYEVGVRHGTGRARTVLIGAQAWVEKGIPFDIGPMRVLTYGIQPDGTMTTASAAALGKALEARIQEEREGHLPTDNPIVQVTGLAPWGGPSHLKVDVFLQRMKYVDELSRRISELVGKKGGEAELEAIERELTSGTSHREVSALHTNLLALYLAWREKRQYDRMEALFPRFPPELQRHRDLAWREKRQYDRMEALFPRFPPELQRTAVALEQLALARNRLAEAAAKGGDRAKADELRTRALEATKQVPADQWTSETWGIVGRIHKGAYDAAQDPLDRKAALRQAIVSYEKGFAADLRDSYPGVNAVTLRAIRNAPEDAQALANLLPAVQYSADHAPPPSEAKRADTYWQTATRLELRCIARDWERAQDLLLEALGLRNEPWMQPWMFDTTADNLAMLKQARAAEAETAQALDAIISRLRAAKA